jgi:predicted DNA-binding protein with PD1-like motif
MMKIEVVRLRPGTDLRGSLEEFVAAHRLAAGFIVSAVGSLSRASLHYAGKDEATLVVRPFEIVSSSGTLSPQGCRLHACVSDDAGNVLGGHVLEGCVVRTTAEIVAGIPARLRFSREMDPETGYRELTVQKGDAEE